MSYPKLVQRSEIQFVYPYPKATLYTHLFDISRIQITLKALS